MEKKWVVHPTEAAAQGIAKEFNLHLVIAQLILRRGLKSSSEIFHFLNPSLSLLDDPLKYPGMQKAVERIRAAIQRKEKILVYGDYDVDGVTGSAILYPILKKLGADADAFIPHRINEGYGLNQESLEKLLKKKYALVITVDNGITGNKQVKFLQEKNVDVIIVDHHLPKEEGLPPAYAIVSAAAGEGQGDPDLAACGLAFKLGWALTGDFKDVESYLDLVVIGTVCDMAPMRGENRILLKYGLPMLANTKRPGLKALMEVSKVSRNYLSYRDIAFGLGPRINASGRMGSPENAFKLLTTENAMEAQNLAQILDAGNRDRQKVESAAFEEALERVETSSLKDHERVLVLESPDWHEGVLGIVASRLVERYHRPSIVISLKNGVGKGSGRSVPHVSLFDFVVQCEELLLNFGGHAQACGLTIKEENVSLFRNRLNEVAVQKTRELSSSSELGIDGEIPFSELDLKFMQDLDKLAPFGPGNKKPLFLSKGVKTKSHPQKKGKDTLQCWITDQEGKTTCEVVGFRMYERWNASRHRSQFDIVYQPALKHFQGIASIQLELEDWQ